MEVVTGCVVDIEEVLTLINNLDMREPLRRYGPKWSTVAVGRGGDILGVYRHKEAFTIDLAYKDVAHLGRGWGAFIIASPGDYPTHEALERKIKDCVEGFELDEEIKANLNRRWFGKTLVIRHTRDE